MRGFKHKNYMKCTELSKYIWNLKNQGITSTVKWTVAKKLTVKFYRITANYAQQKNFLSLNISTTAIY